MADVSLIIDEKTVALGDFVEWDSKVGNRGWDKTTTKRMGVIIKMSAKYDWKGRKIYSVTCKTQVDKYRMSPYFGEVNKPQVEIVGNIRKFEHIQGEIPPWLRQLCPGVSSPSS